WRPAAAVRSSTPESACSACRGRSRRTSNGPRAASRDLDFDGLGPGGLGLGEIHVQHPVLELRFDGSAVHVGRHRESPHELAIRTLGPMEVFGLFLLFLFAFAFHRQHVFVDFNLDVLLLHVGQVRLDDVFLLRFLDVDRRRPVREEAFVVEDTGRRFAEQMVQPRLDALELTERIPLDQAHIDLLPLLYIETVARSRPDGYPGRHRHGICEKRSQTRCTMTLAGTALGLRIAHPFIAGASPLGRDLDTIRRLEDGGAAAIVLPSLFEEQVTLAAEGRIRHMDPLDEQWSANLKHFPTLGDYAFSPDEYAEHIAKARGAVGVPVIGSLNGTTGESWVTFSRLIEQAGASALELNMYEVVADMRISGAAVERQLVQLVSELKRYIKIPIAVKLSPFFA